MQRPQRTTSSMAELDRRIAQLEAKIAPDVAELRRLRRGRAGLLAAMKNAAKRAARIRQEERAIRARWEDLGGGRGCIRILMDEFGLPERTIHRRLENKAARHARLKGRP